MPEVRLFLDHEFLEGDATLGKLGATLARPLLPGGHSHSSHPQGLAARCWCDRTVAARCWRDRTNVRRSEGFSSRKGECGRLGAKSWLGIGVREGVLPEATGYLAEDEGGVSTGTIRAACERYSKGVLGIEGRS